jgi:hypothetical protein
LSREVLQNEQSVLYSNREFIVSSAFPRALQQNKTPRRTLYKRAAAALACGALREAIVSV